MRDLKRPSARLLAAGGLSVALLVALLLVGFEGLLTGAEASVQATQRPAIIPLPADASAMGVAYVSSIACTSSNTCAVAGDYAATGGPRGVLPVESKTGWSTTDVLPTDGNYEDSARRARPFEVTVTVSSG